MELGPEPEPEPELFQKSEPEPEPKLFKSQNRNRNHNFSEVRTGTGTVINSYGSTTLLLSINFWIEPLFRMNPNMGGPMQGGGGGMPMGNNMSGGGVVMTSGGGSGMMAPNQMVGGAMASNQMGVMGGGGGVVGGPMGMQQQQRTGQPREREFIWSGELEWQEKVKDGPADQKISHSVSCTVSTSKVINSNWFDWLIVLTSSDLYTLMWSRIQGKSEMHLKMVIFEYFKL